jgi:hypothetical protein
LAFSGVGYFITLGALQSQLPKHQNSGQSVLMAKKESQNKRKKGYVVGKKLPYEIK